MLRFDADDRKRLDVSVTVPNTVSTSSTVQVEIDDVRYPCEWADDADVSDDTWTRTAQTDDWFAGPSVPADDVAGAVVLSYGLHQPKLVLSDGSAIVTYRLPAFTVYR